MKTTKKSARTRSRAAGGSAQCLNCGHPRPGPGSAAAWQVCEYIEALEKEVKMLRSLARDLDHRIHTNYDWNADKDNMTLRAGWALNAQNPLLERNPGC